MAYGTVNVDAMTTSDGVTSAGTYGFKNRIINGAMVIDQRNAGASVAITAGNNSYLVDRFKSTNSTDGSVTWQQSSTSTSGFANSLLCTIGTADTSLAATQYLDLTQLIEGYNIADLAWGTSSAKSITFSFWVRSSLTGTFGGAIHNSAADRSYPFTYTISSANTFEYKTVTIAGCTDGTWLTTNGIGMYVRFGLGVGSTYSGTAGAWANTVYVSATGATSVVGTNGATFYITGVQLEKGSTATSFDYRPYGTELALCQRYYQALQYNNFVSYRATGSGLGSTQCNLPYLVQTRATPTIAFSASSDGNGGTLTAAGITTNSTRAYGSSTAVAGGVYEGTATMQVTAEL